jgi:hypothetical protein
MDKRSARAVHVRAFREQAIATTAYGLRESERTVARIRRACQVTETTQIQPLAGSFVQVHTPHTADSPAARALASAAGHIVAAYEHMNARLEDGQQWLDEHSGARVQFADPSTSSQDTIRDTARLLENASREHSAVTEGMQRACSEFQDVVTRESSGASPNAQANPVLAAFARGDSPDIPSLRLIAAGPSDMAAQVIQNALNRVETSVARTRSNFRTTLTACGCCDQCLTIPANNFKFARVPKRTAGRSTRLNESNWSGRTSATRCSSERWH